MPKRSGMITSFFAPKTPRPNSIGNTSSAPPDEMDMGNTSSAPPDEMDMVTVPEAGGSGEEGQVPVDQSLTIDVELADQGETSTPITPLLTPKTPIGENDIGVIAARMNQGMTVKIIKCYI